jgi:hypothetical protein
MSVIVQEEAPAQKDVANDATANGEVEEGEDAEGGESTSPNPNYIYIHSSNDISSNIPIDCGTSSCTTQDADHGKHTEPENIRTHAHRRL